MTAAGKAWGEYIKEHPEQNEFQAFMAGFAAGEDRDYPLVIKQGDLLQGVVNAIKGTPPPLTTWSSHDADKLAEQVMDVIAKVRELAEAAAKDYRVSGEHDTWDAYHEGKAGLADEVLDILTKLPHAHEWHPKVSGGSVCRVCNTWDRNRFPETD